MRCWAPSRGTAIDIMVCFGDADGFLGSKLDLCSFAHDDFAVEVGLSLLFVSVGG